MNGERAKNCALLAKMYWIEKDGGGKKRVYILTRVFFLYKRERKRSEYVLVTVRKTREGSQTSG